MTMKNKSSNHGLSYFFRQQIHGKHSSDNLLELAKPELEGTEIEAANIMHWEDAGGQMLDVGSPIDPSSPDMARERANK